MTLTPAIIKDAYRESNSIAKGQEPDSDQVTEGLTLLNRIVAGVYGFEVGDPMFDWPIGQEGMVDAIAHTWTINDWQYPVQNARLIAQSAAAQTIYLPPEPDDGARIGIVDPANRLATYNITLNGNGRPIEDAATLVLSTSGLTRLWFYRADLGKWVRLSELTGAVDEEFPFPQEFDDFFITKLAARLNPRYGRSLAEDSAAALVDTLRRIRSRYRQRQIIPADIGVLALTRGTRPLGGKRIVRGRMGWMR